MRNSLSQDWELFELKRPNVELIKSISGVPSFTSTVHNAIAQLKNYKNILEQDVVKRKFESEGIYYYSPEINLVIGKKSNITNNTWRKLLTQDRELKIITYDQLVEDAKVRLNTIKGFVMND